MASQYIVIAPHLRLTRQPGMHVILRPFQAHGLQRMLSICNKSTIAITTFRGSLLCGPSFTLAQAWADLGSHIWDHIQIGACYRSCYVDTSPLHVLQMLLRSSLVYIKL